MQPDLEVIEGLTEDETSKHLIGRDVRYWSIAKEPGL
jgi:hypothetical protein